MNKTVYEIMHRNRKVAKIDETGSVSYTHLTLPTT